MSGDLTSKELLDCPFCGSEARYIDISDDDGFGVAVECSWGACGVSTMIRYPEKEDGHAQVREAWNRRVRAADEPSAGVKCTHCNGKGYNEPIYDEQDGWTDETPCETCNGSGRITTVEQYLKTLPANWHEDSSLETWFPITAEELKRLKDARATVGPTHWMPLPSPPVTKDAGECGACDKPGEHCANVHGICSRHGGRAHETEAPLTFETFFEKVRETGWNPSPRELATLLYEYEKEHCICSEFQGVNLRCPIHGTAESENDRL